MTEYNQRCLENALTNVATNCQNYPEQASEHFKEMNALGWRLMTFSANEEFLNCVWERVKDDT